MMFQDYKLDNTILKINKTIRLWQTENGILEISEGTLAVLIKQGDQDKGCIFHGHGKLLIDSIIETREGAIGKPIEKELNNLILMLGDVENLQQISDTTKEDDYEELGYTNQQEFVNKAKDLINRFFKTGRKKNIKNSIRHTPKFLVLKILKKNLTF